MMCMDVVPARKHNSVSGACGNRRRSLDLLELLELQMVASHREGSGTQTLVLWKSNWCL